MDIPRSFVIRFDGARILDPVDAATLDTLGRALRLPRGTRVLDLACGKGEMLCRWASEHGITGHGVDLGADYVADAAARARELGVDALVSFEHGDATGYVVDDPVDVAACLGASWIGGERALGRVDGTVALLARSLAPGGMILLGEPFWRLDPPDQQTVEGCWMQHADDCVGLPELLERFDELGYDVVEMVLADEGTWDRYAAAQWLAIRRWLDAHPDDELAGELRAALRTEPATYARYQRRYLGWGVFALMPR